jgi:hypothetical protein
MGDTEKQPISDARREALRKASEAAAAKRRERGSTPAQREALKRANEARRRKAEERKRVSRGGDGTAPIGLGDSDGPEIDAAPYPERPAAPQVEPAPVDPPTELGAEPGAHDAPAVPSHPVTPKKEKTWLQRAMGL